jgi:signal transduction histidine kinase/ActR/RegA family two-component response regulator
LLEILDDGLDELAVSAHAGFLARFAVTLGVGAVFALMLPWRLCLIWAALSGGLEIVAWFATRQQFLRSPVGWRTRLWHLACLAASSAAWVIMGALLWRSGSIEGAVCGVLAWLSLILFAQTNAYQSRVGFLIGGALPGAAVLAIVLLGPNPLRLRLVPVGLTLIIALSFAAEGVMRMLAARRVLDAAQQAVRRNATIWRMLFDQSPLPQILFDASRLYEQLQTHAAAGQGRLGDVLNATLPDLPQALSLITFSQANQACLDLYGVPGFSGAMGAAYFDISFLSGFSDSLNGLRPDGAFPPFDAKVVRADGAMVDVCVHIRTVLEGDAPWSHCIATFVDMTEARRAAEALQTAFDAAEAANLAKSEFLATMSHEIRTPLNGVLGMVQAMQGDPLPPSQRKRLTLIGQSGETLLTILNDVLDLSKIEAGRLELETVDFDLRSLAEAACETFRSMAAAKGLAITLEVDERAEGTWQGDPVRIRQVVSNLISNAVKFTDAGSVRVAIGRAGETVTIAVTDTGIGMAPDQIEPLFDKFAQADSSMTRRFGGTGLGLAICRELCRAMGGEIAAESEIGRGSCFTVRLPLARVAAGGAAPAVGPAAGPLFESRPPRVLAAEDNAVNQMVLRTLLTQAGLEPVIVGDGAEAVAAWEQDDWDVILMDAQMPVMDGLAAAREIRRREAETGRAATPIIALTANAMPHQVETYRAAGMSGFVAKPIQLPELFAAIAAAVEGETASVHYRDTDIR